MLKLTIELVPATCWYSNVRDNVSKSTWDKLRKQTYKDANYTCEICGGKGEEWPVECHEIWEYNDEEHVQTLKGLIALCPNCHKVKHFGLTSSRSEQEMFKAMHHLEKVNGFTSSETVNYVNESINIFHERSKFKWKLDLSYLNRKFGLIVESNRK